MKIKQRQNQMVAFSEIKPGETFRVAKEIMMRAEGYNNRNAVRLEDGALMFFMGGTAVERVYGEFVEGKE